MILKTGRHIYDLGVIRTGKFLRRFIMKTEKALKFVFLDPIIEQNSVARPKKDRLDEKRI